MAVTAAGSSWVGTKARRHVVSPIGHAQHVPFPGGVERLTVDHRLVDGGDQSLQLPALGGGWTGRLGVQRRRASGGEDEPKGGGSDRDHDEPAWRADHGIADETARRFGRAIRVGKCA
ncbi:MAG: hypothetical protein U0802_09615 [Candidatus Binatia bacterium]